MTMMYCPKCWEPVEPSDDGCLCDGCGYFCDTSELLTEPDVTEFNPIRSMVKVLQLHRKICRDEMSMEQLYMLDDAADADMALAVRLRQQSTQAIVEMVGALNRRPAMLKDGHWPEGWEDRHYNACSEPCDMLLGPCCCGAYHSIDEEWVQATLYRHNAIVCT